MAPWPLGCGKAVYHGKSKAAHFMVVGKKRREERAGTSIVPSKAHPLPPMT
jgi:hypothetical protein